MIHVIGDSHVCFFNGCDGITDLHPYAHNNHPFVTHRLGALLAYNFGEYALGPFISSISKTDSLLLCFGEIDCRYHIKNQAIKQNVDVETIIINCVNRYISAIKQLNIKHRVGVWGPIATTPLEEKDSNSQCPIKGDHLERNRITRLFNEHLKSQALSADMLFFSVFNDLLLPDGTTNLFYYIDNIHLAQTAAPLAKAVLELIEC